MFKTLPVSVLMGGGCGSAKVGTRYRCGLRLCLSFEHKLTGIQSPALPGVLRCQGSVVVADLATCP